MSALNPLQVRKPSAHCQVDQRRRCQSTPLRESNLYLLQEGTFSDVTFIVGPSKTKIPCHQLFLKARSSVFEVMFSDRWSQDSVTEVILEDVQPKIFQMFLQYVYAETFKLKVSEALELLQVAHKYDVQLLVDKCVELLDSEATLDDAVDVFQAARQYDKIALMGKFGDFMAKSLSELISHRSFSRVDKQTLMYLLKRSDLKLKEVDLFRLAVKWATFQDGATFQQSLEDILSLIRFPLMTLEDFTTTVAPTGLLSPSTLVELFTYLGTNNAETRKSLASKLKFSTKERAVSNGPNQVRQSLPFVPVELYPRDSDDCRVGRKYKQLFERLEMCISVMDDGVGLSSRPRALLSSQPGRKNVVFSGMSLYCPATTSKANKRKAAQSTKDLKIFVQVKRSYCKNYQDVLTLSGVKAEEGKVTEVEFEPEIPMEIGKYFRFIVKEIRSNGRIGGQDYEVKDLGNIKKSVITTVGDSRVLVACITGSGTLETNGKYANPKLIYRLGFREC